MLLKKANTITTPTAYSNGFLHSVKPEVVENLLLQSNTFSSWSIDDVTLTSGQSGYDGLNDAWLLKQNTNASRHNIFRSVVPLYTGIGTFSIYAKAKELQYIQIAFAQTTNQYANFDLSDGSVGDVGSDFFDAKATSIGDGWYRLSVVNTRQSNSIYISIVTSKTAVWLETFSGANATDGLYIQDAQLNKGYSAYPYLETTTEAIPSADFTFTRNSSATRVNELGYIEDVQIIGGELVSNGDFEEIGSELVTNGSFDTDSDWVKGTGWSISGGKANCDGTQTANSVFYQFIGSQSNKIIKFSFSVSDYVSGTLETSFFGASGTQTYSVTSDGDYVFYVNVQSGHNGNTGFTARVGFQGSIDNVSVKEVGQDWIVTNTDSTHYVEFSEEGARFVADTTSPILTLGQGISLTSGNKYRFSIRLRNNGGTGNIKVQATGLEFIPNILDGTYTQDIVPTTNQSSVSFYRNGADVDLYIESFSIKEVTDDTNLPRINYEGFTYENGLPVPYSGKGHFLLEGQSTNLLPYSEDFSQTDWTKTNVSITSNLSISPDGTQNASLIYPNSTSSGATYIADVINSTTSIYSISAFVKANGKNVAWLYVASSAQYGVIYFDLNDQSIEVVGGSISTPTGTITDMGNGWYKVTLTTGSSLTLSSGSGVGVCDAKGSLSVTKNGTDGILVWGVQLEQGNVSSYIPTNGTAVTRLGETCNNATHSFPSEGVLYAEIAALANDGTYREITINDGTDDNIVEIRYTNTDNLFQYVVRNGSVVQAVINQSLDDATEFNKFALRYKNNDFSAWLNGVQVGTDTSGTAPTGLNRLSFDWGGSNLFYGKTKMVATFPYLSNDEMECLTGEGYGTFEALAAAYSYTIK